MDERKYALLIGSSEFPESNGSLPPLPSALSDVEEMGRVLSSPKHGHFSDVLPLPNLPHHVVLRRINQIVREADRDDLILIYYSGHGALDRQGNLYLTTVNTDPELIQATALSAESVRTLIRETRCRRIVVILDCCYSGAIGGLNLAEKFKSQFSDQGGAVTEGYAIYFMLGTNAITPAYTRDCDQNGLMTKHIVRALESGGADDNADGFISMPELYAYVKKSVSEEAKQIPQCLSFGATGTLIVGRTEDALQNSSLVERIRNAIRQNADQIPDFVQDSAENILEKPEEKIRKDHECAFGLLRDFANRQIDASDLVNQWYLFEKTGLPKTALQDQVVEAEQRWEVVRTCRRPLLDLISPSYVLDKHYHFLDWNPMFDQLIAVPMGLVRGRHAEDFILKLKNRRQVIERSRKKFHDQKMPLVDVEPIEFESPKYGLIRFQKIAAQIAGEDGQTIAWSVNLNIVSAENSGKIWEDMERLLTAHVNWSKYAKSYDKMLLAFDSYNKLVNEVTSRVHGDVIADLACGTGNGTIKLLRQNTRSSVLAFEANEDMLEYMRFKLQEEHSALNSDRVKIYKGDLLTSLREFPNRFIDSAVMINGLYAMEDRARCLREVYRVLKPGGCFVYSTSTCDTNVDHLFAAIRDNLQSKGRLNELRALVDNAYERNVQMKEMIHHDSVDDVVRYATSAGFEVDPETDIARDAYEGAVVIVNATKPRIFRPQPSEPPVIEPEPSPPRTPGSIHVFISYAHEDEPWRERFMQYLKPMVAPGKFEVWADREIEYGEQWNAEIQERLEKTTHAILLVSTAFLNSEYIETKELPLLFQRHLQKDGLRIIPVLLETCLFDEQKYRFPNPKTGPEEVSLDKLQMVSVEKPLGTKSQGQQNETLHEVARYIKKNQP